MSSAARPRLANGAEIGGPLRLHGFFDWGAANPAGLICPIIDAQCLFEVTRLPVFAYKIPERGAALLNGPGQYIRDGLNEARDLGVIERVGRCRRVDS